MRAVTHDADKRRIRGEMRQRRDAMDTTQRRRCSDAIARAVLDSDVYRSARSVFLYLSTPHEVDTAPILCAAWADGKQVYVPKCIGPHTMLAVRLRADDVLISGPMGIREPEDATECTMPEDIDLCLAPCVSVTLDGVRLGYGGGYYDAFLARCGGYKLCLCFESCVSPALPAEPWDVTMDAVCTERGLFPCR